MCISFPGRNVPTKSLRASMYRTSRPQRPRCKKADISRNVMRATSARSGCRRTWRMESGWNSLNPTTEKDSQSLSAAVNQPRCCGIYPRGMPPAVEPETISASGTVSAAQTPLQAQNPVPSGDAPSDQSETFESWGRYPKHKARVVRLNWQSDFPAALSSSAQGGITGAALPVGLGRSYGDVGLLKDGLLLQTTGMDRLLAFDPATGILTAESGISLAQILDFAVPRGFFLPVTPGTKYVTLGGAIANDIHGKNHEYAGSFGCHVPCFELVRSDGKGMLCSRTENQDWYAATIGGVGLTGLITWAQLRLRPIVSRAMDVEYVQFHGIDEWLTLKQQYAAAEYNVSWMDCVSTGRNFARGIFMAGDHARIPGELKPSPEPKLVFP